MSSLIVHLQSGRKQTFQLKKQESKNTNASWDLYLLLGSKFQILEKLRARLSFLGTGLKVC